MQVICIDYHLHFYAQRLGVNACLWCLLGDDTE